MRKEQEEVLLTAFRNMSQEDRELMVSLAIDRSIENMKQMPRLTVITNSLPAGVVPLRRNSG